MNNKLKQLRKEAGFTLQNLSDLCGVSKSHLHDLESQTGSAPKLTTAYAIACVFNCSVYDIWPDETQVTEETFVVRRVVVSNEEIDDEQQRNIRECAGRLDTHTQR